jgi:glycosyltransferase involved in cell wall biosynthesis
MDALANLRVTLIHDWLTGMRGGEKVLEVFCRQWPDANLFTLLHKPGSVCAGIERLNIRTSFLQWLPAVHRYYRYTLPLMPWAVNWRLPECDLVVSSSHCVSKGVNVPAGVPHVCYCYTPMRYAWNLRSQYFAGSKWSLMGWARDRILDRLRDWDLRTAAGVTHFVAISRAVQERIFDCYGRSSVVIYPPVNTDYYCPAPFPEQKQREDYYLLFSAFAPYKRLDLAVEACNLLKRRLVVIGSGQDEKKLRSLAGPTITFLGYQPDEAVRDHLRRCRALIFPGEEDFGIVPVEAQACGCPVIALARGGAMETVAPLEGDWQGPGSVEGPTGVWFAEQTAECLAQAIETMEQAHGEFDPGVLRRHALRFDGGRFATEFFEYVSEVMDTKQRKRRAA